MLLLCGCIHALILSASSVFLILLPWFVWFFLHFFCFHFQFSLPAAMVFHFVLAFLHVWLHLDFLGCCFHIALILCMLVCLMRFFFCFMHVGFVSQWMFFLFRNLEYCLIFCMLGCLWMFFFVVLISSAAEEFFFHACLLCFTTNVVSFWKHGMLFDFLHLWLVMVVFGWCWSFGAYGCLLAFLISCMFGCLWFFCGGVGHLLVFCAFSIGSNCHLLDAFSINSSTTPNLLPLICVNAWSVCSTTSNSLLLFSLFSFVGLLGFFFVYPVFSSSWVCEMLWSCIWCLLFLHVWLLFFMWIF